MGGKNLAIFAVLNLEAGRGPARLRRLVWDQEIAGSNPAAPTTKAVHTVSGFFVRESESLLSSDQQTKIAQFVTFFIVPRNTTQNMVFQVDSEPIADMNWFW